MKFRTLTCTTAMTLFVALGLASSVRAQTFTLLHSFDSTDGSNPFAGLVQAANGTLYGTTQFGGANLDGTTFAISPSGTFSTLDSFDSTDGSDPFARLVQAANGDLYGTTAGGGADGSGTIFKITATGTLTTLYSFCSQSGCVDGEFPYAALAPGTDGNFYGTTREGGANDNCAPSTGCGTVFKIIPNGTLTTLYSFCPQTGCPDGYAPAAGLVQATNGAFYGTTTDGGANGGCSGKGCGTVFKITPSGTLTTLHNFDRTDVFYPRGALIQATNGAFYGTTDNGGAHSYGTVFSITPSGTLTTLYSFCAQSGCTDGEQPIGLVQASDGNFYGATEYGGNGGGTIFEITPSGTLTTLYRFCSQTGCPDGDGPTAVLVQDTNGMFYGTAQVGGAGGLGTVFSLTVGLGPFVETQPTSGKAGAVVKVLGTDLTGATSVTFNGAAAVFKVISPSEIGTTVPSGATTGPVQVVTPSGTLKSNVKFEVRP